MAGKKQTFTNIAADISVDTAPSGYAEWLAEVKSDIRRAQTRALMAVNSEMTMVYWRIGRDILERQEQHGWGAKVIQRVSADLRKEFGSAGYGPRNVSYMRAVAAAWPDERIMQTLSAQLHWSQMTLILDKLNEPEERLWYAKAAFQHGWSVRLLAHHIDARLHEREGKSLNNFTATIPPPDSDMVAAAFKDPYILDFVALAHDAHERRLEAKLIERIRDFLMEMGKGFAFAGSQYHLNVGGQDYYIDLLFYHIPLHRYVVVDLKMGAFTPEFAGKMNFYITAVNRLLCGPGENETVGLILCRDHERLIVDYSLGNIAAPIAVAKYRHNVLPPPLAAALPDPEAVEAGLKAIIAETDEISDDGED